MNRKYFRLGVFWAAISVLSTFVFIEAFVGRNDLHTWQVVQQLNGNVYVQNEQGWYIKWLAYVTTYPEMLEIEGTTNGSKLSPKDSSAQVKFNDGGTADLDFYCRARTPKPVGNETPEELAVIVQRQRDFHRQFRNADNAKVAIRSHVRDCIGKTGPIMSSSENQASRKAEFYEVCLGQIRDGFYKMQKVTIRRKDSVTDMMKQADQKGVVAKVAADSPVAPDKKSEGTKSTSGISVAQQPMNIVGEQMVQATDTVLAAEVVKDKDGKPIIAVKSPLVTYGMPVLQFSLSKTKFDSGTLKKFADKRALLLQAQLSQAEAVKSAQTRLLNIAQGDRQVAETEWESNKKKASEVVQAETLQMVEGIKKQLREVEGQTKVEVAKVAGKTLEASRQATEFDAQTAENSRKAAEITASAQEQMINLAGGITEREQELLQIQLDETKGVATALSKMPVPDIVVMSSEGVTPGQSPLVRAIPGLQLLDLAGIMTKRTGQEIESLRYKPIETEKPKFPVTPTVDKKAQAN